MERVMKKLYLILLFLVAPTIANADMWCKWDGQEGTECQSDSKGFIFDERGFRVSTPSIANANGYFRLVDTQPVIGQNQVRDAVLWGFSNNEITRTWTVRNLTAEEIDQNTARPMPLNTYYLWKALLVKGAITQQEAANALPQELIDAYQARDRLETN